MNHCSIILLNKAGEKWCHNWIFGCGYELGFGCGFGFGTKLPGTMLMSVFSSKKRFKSPIMKEAIEIQILYLYE